MELETLFMWEVNLLNDMLEVLDGCVCSQVDDAWKWRVEENSMFSMNSTNLKSGGNLVETP
jgi:hypothetical protein